MLSCQIYIIIHFVNTSHDCVTGVAGLHLTAKSPLTPLRASPHPYDSLTADLRGAHVLQNGSQSGINPLSTGSYLHGLKMEASASGMFVCTCTYFQLRQPKSSTLNTIYQ